MPNIDKAYGALKMIGINIYNKDNKLKNTDLVLEELSIIWDELEENQKECINEIFNE